MKKLWDAGIIQRILGLTIIISLLGIAPQPHIVRRGFEVARQAQSRNNLRAADELAQLAEQIPWRVDLWEQAGHNAMAEVAYEKAIEYFDQAQAINQLTAWGYLELGNAYQFVGETDLAIHTWETLNKKFTSSEESLARLAKAYFAKGDFTGTISALKEILEFQSPTSNIQYPISDLYYDLGILLAAHEPASSPPYLLQAAEHDPNGQTFARELAFVIQRALPKDEPVYTLLVSGQKLAQQGLWQYAAHAFERATQLRPDYAEAWAYLGEAYQQLDYPPPERGLAELEQALTLDPESLAANTFMAIFWQRQGDHQQALVYLQSATDLDPYNATLQIHLGEMWAQLGDLATAQTLYESAIQLDPYDPSSYQALAEFCIRYNLDLYGIALPAARQSVSLSPNNPASLDVMGQVLFRLGDYINAERYMLQALQHDEHYPPTHLHLGLLYTLTERPAMAETHLSLAISLAPHSRTAEYARRLIQENSAP